MPKIGNGIVSWKANFTKINMKPDSLFSRYTLLWIVILCYLLPLICIDAYNTFATHPSKSWIVLSLGLLLTSMGTLALFWMISKWEILIRTNTSPVAKPHFPPVEQIAIAQPMMPTITIEELEKHRATLSALEDSQKTNAILHADIEKMTHELHELSLEKDHQQLLVGQMRNELEECRQTSCQQLQQQQTLIRELHTIIAEQKGAIEKKQLQIGHLDGKVHDLTYEIKTLLQLAEAHSSTLSSSTSQPSFSSSESGEDGVYPYPEKQIRTSEEASQQLKRCLDIAQKITGSNRFNSQINSFLDSPADSFAIDLRRLCDSLRSENGSTIILYSPKENQLLFANNQIKALTGWSPEKFVQNFSAILQDDNMWKQGVSSLSMRSEAQVKLSLKSKTGQDVLVNGHLGMIPTGIFKHHAIAVLY
jgi:uncharacterized coiled-coil protein SlyX